MAHYLCRFGCRGEVGRFRALGTEKLARGSDVLCQTQMGVWVGQILAPIDDDTPCDALILRRMTPEDHLLEARLRKGRERAIRRCQQLIDQADLPVTLLDVDHLFDGRTLLFYFAGKVDAAVESITQELVEEYEGQVQSRRFAKLLSTGCGPGCGTGEGNGCGGSCAGCVVAKACAKEPAGEGQVAR